MVGAVIGNVVAKREVSGMTPIAMNSTRVFTECSRSLVA
jgi:hypothetical protein